MKINIQKLRGMGYKAENHTPWGDCIVVPEKEFKEDWESELDVQGHPYVHVEICSKKLVLVRLMGEQVMSVESARPEEIGVTTPAAPTESRSAASTVKPTKRVPGWFKKHPEKMWKDDEKDKLIKLWNQRPRLSVPVMAKDFLNRTEGALYAELNELEKAGLIEPRNRKHPKPPKRKPKRSKSIPGIPAPGSATVEGASTVEVSCSVQKVSTVIIPPSHLVLTVVLELKGV
jgi:hypothetical protein